MSQVTISGAASGLDTASLINSLVSVQTNQQTQLKNQQSTVQQRSTALASLGSALSALGTTTAELAKTDAWKGASVTSSSSSVSASVTATTSGSLTFDVTALAAAHSVISTSSVAATSTVVASGPITLTAQDGSTRSVDVGGGTLGEVVNAVNGAKAGVTAAAVKVGPGSYRLQLTATASGEASRFTVDGLDGFDGTAVLTQGSDAQLTVGTDSAASYTVTSATNTFADLMPGVSFTVGKKETGVTVSARLDGSSVADKLNSLVTQANNILTSIDAGTAYDAAKKTSGVLAGEGSVRTLRQNLLSSVSGIAAPGVDVTRDGRLKFDRQAFLDAYAKDPDGVAKAFGYSGGLTAAAPAQDTSARISSALTSAHAGSYPITVTTPPAREQWSMETGGSLDGRTLTLTRGSATLTYAADAGLTLAQAAAAFNSASAAAGFGVTAAVSDTVLVLTASGAGASRAFTPTLDGNTGDQLAVGTDIGGTIDGQAALGSGSVLSLPTGTGGAVGLSVDVTTTAADVAVTGGAIGRISYQPGLAQRMATLVSDATSSTGSLTTARTSADGEVKRYQTEIDDWNTRLTTYRETLTRQFTAMETAIQRLKSSSSAISSLVGALSSSSGSSGSSGSASTSG